jgi:hypothetical protein
VLPRFSFARVVDVVVAAAPEGKPPPPSRKTPLFHDAKMPLRPIPQRDLHVHARKMQRTNKEESGENVGDRKI